MGVATGTAALLMTDVVGSTALWQSYPVEMNAAMARHHLLVSEAVAHHGGRLPVDQGEGDARFAVFTTASAALEAAVAMQLAFSEEQWLLPSPLRVRMGAHVGEVIERDGNLFGDPVNRCARIRGVAHGGQVLVSAMLAALVGDRLPEGLTLLDLGQHLMKDLARPDRIFQVCHPGLPSEFPALLSLERARHNLPVQLSSFVGRQTAIDELVSLIAVRQLVTVTGFGGMGKTRLALQVGAESADGAGDGVWFVDLSAVRDAALVAESVNRVLGVASSPEGAAVALAGFLADKQILLIVDNVEQLMPEVASVIAAMAASGSGVRVLTTSREPLGVRGEHVYPLEPLAFPGGGSRLETKASLGVYEAVTLFIARATAADPKFTVDNVSAPAVAAICARLDGWPLALELAAARVRLLGVTGLLARLTDRLGVLTGGARDGPERQRTLRETIVWSYELLGQAEQVLLARMSVFTGGATMLAIEVVCGPDLGKDVLDALGSLIDKSLVRATETGAGSRYRLLETVREYAAERLAESLAEGGELNGTRDRHAAHYLARFTDGDASIAMDQDGRAVTEDVANLDLAVRHLGASDGAAASRLLTAVYRRMSQLGRQPQLRDWAQEVLSVAELSPLDNALLRSIRGHILYNVSNEWPEGADDFLDAVHTLMQLDVASYTAIMGCNYSASHLVDCGRFEEATEITDQAIRWARELGRPGELNLALSAAQYVARFRQDIGRAIELGSEGLELMRGTEDRMGLSNALGELVGTLVAAGRFDEAQVLADEAEQMLEEKGGPTIRAVVVRALGRSRIAVGRYREAIGFLMELIRLDTQTGATFREPGWVALAIEALDPSIAATVLGAAQRMQVETGDPDVMPPPAVGGDFERRLQEAHPGNVERGARLGWTAIQPEVREWAAHIPDKSDEYLDIATE